VGLRFFGLFCKALLRAILTPPARCQYQHPHDANNPQVGHWGNFKPKWWPQGSTFSSSKTKQRTHKAKRGELNGLVVHGDVRIGLTLYSSSCSSRYELTFFSEEIKNRCPLEKEMSEKKKKQIAKTPHIGGHQRELARKGRPHIQHPAAGAHMRWHVHNRRKGHLKKKRGKSVGCFLGLFFGSLSSFFFFFFGGPLKKTMHVRARALFGLGSGFWIVDWLPKAPKSQKPKARSSLMCHVSPSDL
jgi:hypothetical protein